MSERPKDRGQSVPNPLASWGFVVSLVTLVVAPVAWVIFTSWAFQGLFEGWDDGRTSLSGPSNAQVILGLIALLAIVFAGLVSGLLLSITGLKRADKVNKQDCGLAIAGLIISSFGLGAFVLAGLGLALG